VSVKILEIVSGLGSGGAEKSFIARMNHVPKSWNITVLNTLPELNQLRVPEGIPVVELARYHWNFVKLFKKITLQLSPDLVITRSPIDFILISLIKFGSRAKWGMVFEAHSVRISNNQILDFLLRVPLQLFLKHTALVIAVSESVAQGLQCKGARNIQVHLLGAQTNVLPKHNVDLNFLFAGRLVDLKQPLFLLGAVAQLADKCRKNGTVFHIVGEGELGEAVDKFISANNLSDVVRCYGYLNNLDSIFAQCDYLVSTSKFEGLPIVFFEAKLNGLKVITTPSATNFEILGPEDLIMKDFKLSSLVEALENALSKGPVPDSERRIIQEDNQWLQSSVRCEIYFDYILRLYLNS
jgi:glycosyltransferase involved in cell wall biosynthesis